ncbi:hypothetical protein CD133_03510, partial [Staphylococcus massiliensis CCUG 55927]
IILIFQLRLYMIINISQHRYSFLISIVFKIKIIDIKCKRKPLIKRFIDVVTETKYYFRKILQSQLEVNFLI